MILKTFYFFLLFGLLACTGKKQAADPDVYYTCSMDPQVVSDKPGKCPICKMELTPVKRSSVKQTDDIQLSEQQVKLGNIITDTIRTGNIGEEIVLNGTLNQNGNAVNSVSARLMGRIEKLYVKNAGDYVSKGMPLYELYSEELNNAKQEYILTLQRRKLFTEQSVIDFDQVIRSAANKLRLWGMTESQIRSLEHSGKATTTTTFYNDKSGYVTTVDVTEGSYVMEGGTILQLANLSTLWAEAEVYASQLSRIPRSAQAVVEIPGVHVATGRIEFASPELAEGSRINRLRITINNAGNKLTPGMPAYIRVKTQQRNALYLPSDAVIREKNGATVWLKTGEETFRSQMVTLGMEGDGLVEILHGLKEGDVVVVSGTYLLHSEFVFKRGADPMAGHGH